MILIVVAKIILACVCLFCYVSTLILYVYIYMCMLRLSVVENDNVIKNCIRAHYSSNGKRELLDTSIHSTIIKRIFLLLCYYTPFDS